MVRVELLTEEAWERYAAVRLRALRESPGAFAASLAREESFREQHWRMRLRSAPTWLATVDDADAGLARGIEEPGAPPEERHLVSFWVAPEHRRRGAGRALLAAAEAWAAGAGATTLTLWVMEGNDAAVAFYAACGWTPSDVTMALPRDPRVVERRWTRRLDGGG